MNTLQSIRDKLRAINCEATPAPTAAAVMPTSAGSGYTVCIIVGLIVGVLVTVLLVKLWQAYRADGRAAESSHQPMPPKPPADLFAAQLADRIRAAQPRVEPVPVAPVPAHHPPPVIGDMPRPEVPVAQPQQDYAMQPAALEPGLQDDPFLTPL
jgi:hypothetical protein